jgi:hypothetical protein
MFLIDRNVLLGKSKFITPKKDLPLYLIKMKNAKLKKDIERLKKAKAKKNIEQRKSRFK